jgi:hypothetical protein
MFKISDGLIETEIPRRINSTNIFTSKGDDFDNLILSLASFPAVCIIFGDPLSQIGASKMIFLVGINQNDTVIKTNFFHLAPSRMENPPITIHANVNLLEMKTRRVSKTRRVC